MFFQFYETLNGLKKFAILLPNSWLAETPQTLGRQSADRERISEISWNIFEEKNCRQIRFLEFVYSLSICFHKQVLFELQDFFILYLDFH